MIDFKTLRFYCYNKYIIFTIKSQCGGDGGNRIPVQKETPRKSTYLACFFWFKLKN